ncbi:3-hydroxybutyrate oligomer hydrolase family protein [Lysobacter solisilvae (ex Woo and Kim 2020)]|uniref:Hydrogenase n=1 Tax=Agrilutibacter terrestris TaxID=2865112 RepID=A0A7H0G0T0_9GAMM|nr:3-hydroxybutyrate oligomer hydrolase family protein [Lysobacter terrestris]QNP41896.1 hydrogenase [Lysobacter terrestris]
MTPFLSRRALRTVATLGLVAGLAACATGPRLGKDSTMFYALRNSEHRGGDDLLTAGLGLDGLRSPAAPAFADPVQPTPAELRRRAIWSNWRGIADLAPAGGFGTLYGNAAAVPGREYHALATVPGASQPHRVMVQVPDGFDRAKRCLVVTASSGSRGIYGAIAVAGGWGLPHGCAVAYTDKGAGTDYFDLDAGTGVAIDGSTQPGAGPLAFAPTPGTGHGVAFKHAHSGDNPEADWGRHVQQAARFGLQALEAAFPEQAPFTFANTRVIAAGISNGAGAVLRAAELEGRGDEAGWLDAVVAGEPNVNVDGARALYDYGTEAALLMPCALLDFNDLPASPLSAQARALAPLRCASLAATGVLPAGEVKLQARAAHEQLNASGWTDAALRASALSVEFDLWRALGATYASAYGRFATGAHPCGFSFAAQNPDFSPRAATDAERAAWWSDASGIPPGAGVGLIDTQLAAPDFTFNGVQCLRALWTGAGADAQRVQRGVAEVRAGLPRAGVPVVVVHGLDDNVVPPAFSSAPYVARAQAAGRDVRYWQVRNVQHFDAFLVLPDYRARYAPLLPYMHAALDRVAAHLDDAAQPLPGDAVIEAVPGAAAPAIPR